MATESNSGNKWYVRIADTVHGPFSSEKIRKLAEQGKIDKDDEIRMTSKPIWRRAGKMRGLFPDSPPVAKDKKQPAVGLTRRKARTLADVDAAQSQRSRNIQALFAVGVPFFFGLLIACLVTNATVGQRILIVLVTCASLCLLTIPVFVYQFYPEYRMWFTKAHEVLVGAVVGIAGLSVLGLMVHAFISNPAGFIRMSEKRNETVELPGRKPGEWAEYVDPKGRFVCEVPPDWSIEAATLDDPQSKVVLHFQGQEIRITVRDTKMPAMYDGIQEEMVKGMGESALKMGADGKVEDVVWTELDGDRALRIDIGSTQKDRFARTIKSKLGGWDHFIGLYLEPRDAREKFHPLFEEFLSRYRVPN